ncbi:hypothetical protein C8F01DRAFT_1266461 [Mycena amicta]|nr:hypothetical protein C8F01DRAFT_1266461 [Mycena amicta]
MAGGHLYVASTIASSGATMSFQRPPEKRNLESNGWKAAVCHRLDSPGLTRRWTTDSSVPRRSAIPRAGSPTHFESTLSILPGPSPLSVSTLAGSAKYPSPSSSRKSHPPSTSPSRAFPVLWAFPAPILDWAGYHARGPSHPLTGGSNTTPSDRFEPSAPNGPTLCTDVSICRMWLDEERPDDVAMETPCHQLGLANIYHAQHTHHTTSLEIWRKLSLYRLLPNRLPSIVSIRPPRPRLCFAVCVGQRCPRIRFPPPPSTTLRESTKRESEIGSGSFWYPHRYATGVVPSTLPSISSTISQTRRSSRPMRTLLPPSLNLPLDRLSPIRMMPRTSVYSAGPSRNPGVVLGLVYRSTRCSMRRQTKGLCLSTFVVSGAGPPPTSSSIVIANGHDTTLTCVFAVPRGVSAARSRSGGISSETSVGKSHLGEGRDASSQ